MLPSGPRSLCRLLGVEVPLLLGGMTWVGRHALAAAVSEAGALGVIGSGGMDPDELRDEIAALRALTGATFGVNVPLVNVRPDADESMVERLVDVVRDEAVPVVVTGGGSPRRFTAALRETGARVLHVVPSTRLARKAADAGVDAIVAESFEAGGHLSPDGLATFSLLPQVVDAVDLPVVAAGGIADGRGMAAALALGACAVQIGTRFIATHECCAHPDYKRALVETHEHGTAVYCRAYHASRALATPVVRRLVELEEAGASPEELRSYRGRDRARRGCLEGDLESGLLPAGAASGLVREVASAGDVVREIVDACRARLRALSDDDPTSQSGPRAA